MNEEEVEDLFTDWIDARLSLISEYSGGTESYKDFIDKARERAKDIGIEWSDCFIPSYIWETISLST